MLASQQHMRSDLQSNNEVVQGMQNAQKEHKANMDMMNKQLSQLANSMSEIKGNSGRLPSTVHIPEKANVSKITLRSGTSYKEPEMKVSLGWPSKVGGTSDSLIAGSNRMRFGDTISSEILGRPLPRMKDPFFLEEEPRVEKEKEDELTRRGGQDRTEPVTEPPSEGTKESSEGINKGPDETVKGEKPFPYRFVKKRKKEDPVDYLSIFGKLDVTIPFLQAVKLPPLGKFTKEFIAGKAKEDGKIVVEGIASAIVQEKLPPKRADPGMFTLPITIENVKIEHAMCDLGASINVMPLSIYNRLKGVKLTNTRVLIQLAD